MVQNQSTNKRSFKHLTAYDRSKIAVLHNQGKSLQVIADEISCHKSTISRELKRGTTEQMKSDKIYFIIYIFMMP